MRLILTREDDIAVVFSHNTETDASCRVYADYFARNNTLYEVREKLRDIKPFHISRNGEISAYTTYNKRVNIRFEEETSEGTIFIVIRRPDMNMEWLRKVSMVSVQI
jgi:hypothetical protein